MLRVARAGFEKLGWNLGVELGLARTNDLGNASPRVPIGRVALSERPRKLDLARIDVCDGDLLRSCRPRLEDLDGTPIGQLGDREAGDRCERRPVVERGDERLPSPGEELASLLRALLLGHVAEHEDHAEEAPAFVTNGGCAIVDRSLFAALRPEERMVREPYDYPLAKDLRHGALHPLPGALGENTEHLVESPAARLTHVPAGQAFGDRVHERNVAVAIGRDHRIADAAQRGLKPSTRLVFSLRARRASQRLRALLGERLDERSFLRRKPSRVVEAHPQETHGLSFDDERHAPKRGGPSPFRLHPRKRGKQHVVIALILGPNGLAGLQRRERLGIAGRLGDAADPVDDLGGDAAMTDELEGRPARFEHVERARVGADRSRPLFDDHGRHLGSGPHFGEGSGDVGESLEPPPRVSPQPLQEIRAIALNMPRKAQEPGGGKREQEAAPQGDQRACLRLRTTLAEKPAFFGADLFRIPLERVREALAFPKKGTGARLVQATGVHERDDLAQATHRRLCVAVRGLDILHLHGVVDHQIPDDRGLRSLF